MTDPEPASKNGAHRAGFAELEFGIAAAGAVAGLLVTLSLAQDLTRWEYGYTRLLDVDIEASAYTWLSSSIILVTALTIFHIAWEMRARAQAGWRGWGVLGLVLLGLSSEEILAIHERLAHRIYEAAPAQAIDVQLAWSAPAMVLCLLGLLAAIPFLRGVPLWTRRRMLAAGLAYVGGAAGVEAVQGLMASSWSIVSVPMILLQHTEEGFEVAGMLLMLHTVAVHRRTMDA